MKHVFFTILFLNFLLVAPSVAQTKSGKVVYKVKIKEDAWENYLKESKGTSQAYSIQKRLFSTLEKGIGFLEFDLNFNRTKSHFSSQNTMVRDDGQDLDLIKKIIGSYGDYYTDLPENKLLHAFEYLGKSWLLPYYKADFQWVITDEVKIINGYECRKAVTFHSPLTEKEKETVAWFAPQIPFQFGPMEYFGLPGLVLEIQKDFYVFYANEISFAEKDKKIPRPTLKKETEISRYKNEIKELEFKMKKVHVLQSQGG